MQGLKLYNLLEISWELFGIKVLDEVPLICLSTKE